MQDLAAFRLSLADLLKQAQAAGMDAALLIEVSDQARDLVDELRSRRYRPGTLWQIERVRKLERQLAGYDPRDRVAAICERMDIRRSRYFELRKLAASPVAGPDSVSVQSSNDAEVDQLLTKLRKRYGQE